MSVHIDITGLRPEEAAVVPSPLAELGMALHALSEPAHHPGLQGWVTGVTARLDPHLADRMCEACGGRRSRTSSSRTDRSARTCWSGRRSCRSTRCACPCWPRPICCGV